MLILFDEGVQLLVVDAHAESEAKCSSESSQTFQISQSMFEYVLCKVCYQC